MSAPVFRSATAAPIISDQTAWSPTYPTGVQVGDAVYFILATKPGTRTGPAGFDEVASADYNEFVGGSDYGLGIRIYRRIYDGTEGTTATATVSPRREGFALMVAFTAGDPDGDLDTGAVTGIAGVLSTLPLPAHTIDEADALSLLVWLHNDNVAQFAAVPGYTKVWSSSSSAGSDSAGGVWYANTSHDDGDLPAVNLSVGGTDPALAIRFALKGAPAADAVDIDTELVAKSVAPSRLVAGESKLGDFLEAPSARPRKVSIDVYDFDGAKLVTLEGGSE